MPQIRSSLQKLDAMMKIFVDEGDGKLGRGEVDAIAGFVNGISSRSLGAAGVRDRIIDIYRSSTFATGQKAWLLQGLERAGIPATELEGVDPNTAEGFAKMSKTAQADRILQLAGDWGDGYTRAITQAQVPTGARNQILREVEAFKADYLRDHTIDPDIGDPFEEGLSFGKIFLSQDDRGRGKEHVGYQAEVHIYVGAQVDEMLYFNRKGELLTSEYHGE